jgi:hypothetical protein
MTMISISEYALRFVGCKALAVIPLALFVGEKAWAKPFIAEGSTPPGDVYLTPMVGVGFDEFLEIGFAGSFLVAREGFIPPVNESVHVEGALFQDVVGEDPTGSIGARMRWDFHFHPKWTVYGAPGVAVRYGDADRGTGLRLTGNVGGFYHLDEGLSLRAESDVVGHGRHFGVRGGVSFKF